MSPALAGGFLTTVTPGKPLSASLMHKCGPQFLRPKARARVMANLMRNNTAKWTRKIFYLTDFKWRSKLSGTDTFPIYISCFLKCCLPEQNNNIFLVTWRKRCWYCLLIFADTQFSNSLTQKHYTKAFYNLNTVVNTLLNKVLSHLGSEVTSESLPDFYSPQTISPRRWFKRLILEILATCMFYRDLDLECFTF